MSHFQKFIMNFIRLDKVIKYITLYHIKRSSHMRNEDENDDVNAQ